MSIFLSRMCHNLLLNYRIYEKMDVFRPQPASEREMTKFHSDDYVAFLKVHPDSSVTSIGILKVLLGSLKVLLSYLQGMHVLAESITLTTGISWIIVSFQKRLSRPSTPSRTAGLSEFWLLVFCPETCMPQSMHRCIDFLLYMNETVTDHSRSMNMHKFNGALIITSERVHTHEVLREIDGRSQMHWCTRCTDDRNI